MKRKLGVISIAFIFVLAVVVNKLINERTVENFGRAFLEMHDDRLLAESYIYELNDLFYKKKVTLLVHELHKQSKIDKNEIQRQTSSIIEVIRKYSITKFTENERVIFEKLNDNVRHLKIAEAKLFSQQISDINELIKHCETASDYLTSLSAIQVSEGNLLNESSKKTVAFSRLVAQLEWAVYIIILLVLISNLRYRKIVEIIFPKHQLN